MHKGKSQLNSPGCGGLGTQNTTPRAGARASHAGQEQQVPALFSPSPRGRFFSPHFFLLIPQHHGKAGGKGASLRAAMGQVQGVGELKDTSP